MTAPSRAVISHPAGDPRPTGSAQPARAVPHADRPERLPVDDRPYPGAPRRAAGYREEDFLYSRESWNFICRTIPAHCTDPSFVDYFWTVRIMHAPLWRLMEVAEDFIPVRAYHTPPATPVSSAPC
jgi:hypothetical protein